jgi:hypothetical protein
VTIAIGFVLLRGHPAPNAPDVSVGVAPPAAPPRAPVAIPSPTIAEPVPPSADTRAPEAPLAIRGSSPVVVQATPTVRAEPPTVSGLLSPESVRRVGLRNLGQVNRCYEIGLATDPRLAGRVVIRFVIGASGSVMGSSVGDSQLALPSVGECIANAIRRWQFPAPEGGGVVTVNYPFNLTTRDAEPPTRRGLRARPASEPDLGDLGL